MFTLERKKIFGSGALNWDIFYRVKDLREFSFLGFSFEPGKEYVFERPIFLELLKVLEKEAELIYQCGGGSSANTIYALSTWGFQTGFVGAVGEDQFGERILKELSQEGVDTTFIRKGGQTSLAIILLDHSKDRTIIVSPGTSETILLELNLRSLPPGFYHLSSLASPEGRAFHQALVEQLEYPLSLDPGEIYSDLGKDFLIPFLQKALLLFITEDELRNAGLTVDGVLDLGVRYLFVKKGQHGALGVMRGEVHRSSVFPVKEIVDNTGAGDYFNAGVLAGFSLGLSLGASLELALFSAGLSLRAYGRGGILSKEEFKKFLKRLK